MYDSKRRKSQEISSDLKDKLRALSLNPDSPPLTVAEAANITNTSQKFWRNKIFNREIKYLKIGRSVRIPVIEIIVVIDVIAPFILNCEGVDHD
ncbi:MAG: helix-turn-helix domain-containing protein [Candidatus Marinimicrobia bacterium]|nr:helix-turn-helix domain-containing protein [Candidatus Neomarinimicrobiota bacterium]